jgi:hypothetical protein
MIRLPHFSALGAQKQSAPRKRGKTLSLRGATLSPTAPASRRREREIQTQILALLHARGVVCWKAGSGGFRVTDTAGRERYVKMGHTGVADIIGVIPWCKLFDKAADSPHADSLGRFLAVEVKQPGKDATPEQANFLASVRQAGGLAFVAHSCEEVAKALGWTP